MRWPLLVVTATTVVAQAVACAPVVPGGDGGTSARDVACLECHDDVESAWEKPGSHRLLFTCRDCHMLLLDEPGPGHADLPPCSGCHSEPSHRAGMACSRCHTPHGSDNLSLIRATIVVDGTGDVASVRYMQPRGAEVDGLARGSAVPNQAGQGLCEICHTTTAYYNRTGTGAPHQTAYCGQCHDHQLGFAEGH